jgi:hypothetical protein
MIKPWVQKKTRVGGFGSPFSDPPDGEPDGEAEAPPVVVNAPAMGPASEASSSGKAAVVVPSDDEPTGTEAATLMSLKASSMASPPLHSTCVSVHVSYYPKSLHVSYYPMRH